MKRALGGVAAILLLLPGVALPASPARAQEALFAPHDEIDRVTLAELGKARRRVRLAYFNISLHSAVGTLVDLKARGVDVLVLVDAKTEAQSYNVVDDLLEAAGVPVRRIVNLRSRYASLHHKIAVVDGEVVITGSGNLSYTGTHSNHESALVLRDADAARIFEEELAEAVAIDDYVRSELTPAEVRDFVERERYPSWWTPGRGRADQIVRHIRSLDRATRQPASLPHVRLAFAPEERLDTAILRELDGARESVHVACFSIGMENLARKLADLAARGVRVEVVTDANQLAEPHTQAAGAILRNAAAAGLRLIPARNPSAHYAAMHHKFVVIDRRVVCAGAYNWNAQATFNNDEALVTVRDPAVAARFYREYVNLAARYDPQFDAARYDAATYGALAATPTEVTFVARHSRTAWGETVCVIGDLPALGAWDPARAVPLRTGGNVFPSWIGSVPIPAGTRFEYKFIVRRPRPGGGGDEVVWEDGWNRDYTVPADGLNRTLLDDFRK